LIAEKPVYEQNFDEGTFLANGPQLVRGSKIVKGEIVEEGKRLEMKDGKVVGRAEKPLAEPIVVFDSLEYS
jgi:hypothetical protein